MRTARGLRTSINDETALAWGPKVTAAKNMSLTPEEAEQRWREQLRVEAERRADSYAAVASEFQKKSQSQHCFNRTARQRTVKGEIHRSKALAGSRKNCLTTRSSN